MRDEAQSNLNQQATGKKCQTYLERLLKTHPASTSLGLLFSSFILKCSKIQEWKKIVVKILFKNLSVLSPSKKLDVCGFVLYMKTIKNMTIFGRKQWIVCNRMTQCQEFSDDVEGGGRGRKRQVLMSLEVKWNHRSVAHLLGVYLFCIPLKISRKNNKKRAQVQWQHSTSEAHTYFQRDHKANEELRGAFLFFWKQQQKQKLSNFAHSSSVSFLVFVSWFPSYSTNNTTQAPPIPWNISCELFIMTHVIVF